MRKNPLFTILAVTAALVSCNEKEFNNIQPAGSDDVINEISTTADAFIMDNATRASISNQLAFSWKKTSDKMGVFPEIDLQEGTDASQVRFVANADGNNAVIFKGNGWGLLPDRKYYAYYPYADAALATKVTGTYTATFTQSGNNSTAHLNNNIFMYTSATTPQAGNKAAFYFHHLGSLMKLDITVPDDAKSSTFKKLVLSTSEPVFIAKFQYNPTTDEPVLEAVTTTGKQTLNFNFAPTDGKLSLWFLIGAVDLTGVTVNVELSGDAGMLQGSFAGVDQARGKAHLYELSVGKAQIPDSEYYVDLGLPSGIKWAKSNLTVNGFAYPADPTVFGDYYAWGETEPYYTSLKVNGEQNVTVTWKSGYEGGYTQGNYNKNTALSAYTSASDKLSLEHDAAHVVLGGNWRTPSVADLDELEANCTVSAATLDGVNGVKYTSNLNGESIFMPCNGYFNGTTFKGYTASSPANRFWMIDNSTATTAYQQYGAQSSPGTHAYGAKDKWRGASIRPVYVPEE